MRPRKTVKKLKEKKQAKKRKMPNKKLGNKLVTKTAELVVYNRILELLGSTMCIVAERLPFIFVAKSVELQVHRKNRNNALSFQPTEGPKKEVLCILAALYIGRRDEMIDAVYLAEDDYLNNLVEKSGCKLHCIQNAGEVEGVLKSIGRSPNEWED